jgi:hypothetical protein
VNRLALQDAPNNTKVSIVGHCMRYSHWQFFESVDDELHSLSRIIEFERENFSTFSVSLSRLYLSVASEIDVVAKLLCARIAPTEKPKRISEYRPLVMAEFPNFAQLRIEMPSHELDFQPWLSWSSGTSPQWWMTYNDVHERSKYYRDANLGNVLESTAGLLVLLVYFHQPELYSKNSPIQPDFKMMRIDRRYAGALTWGFSYSLPDFGKSHDSPVPATSRS